MKNVFLILVMALLGIAIYVLLSKSEKIEETPSKNENQPTALKHKENTPNLKNEHTPPPVQKPITPIKNEVEIVNGIKERKTSITLEDEIYTKEFVKSPNLIEIAEPVLMRSKLPYIQWTLQLSASVAGQIAVVDDKIFFGTYDYQSIIAKADSGELLGRVRTTSQPVNSTMIYKNLFIIAQRNGQITAYQQADGKEIWNHRSVVDKPNNPIDFSISGICLLEDKIGVIKHWGNLYLLNANNGVMNLDLGVEYESRISIPAIPTENHIIFANVAGELHAFNKDGTKSFTHSLEKGYAISMISDKQSIYIATTEKQLIAIDTNTKKTKWQIETTGYAFDSLLINANTLYCSAGNLYAIDPSNGQIKWQIKSTDTNGFCRGKVILSEYNLIAAEQNGHIIEANQSTGAITKETNLKEEIKSPLSASTDLIFIPTLKKKIYALKKNATW